MICAPGPPKTMSGSCRCTFCQPAPVEPDHIESGPWLVPAYIAVVPGRAPKAYRLLRTILNTAVSDGHLARNPCQVKGAAQDRTAERLIPTVAEVQALADAMPDRLALLVLLAAWCGFRRGELLALRRSDVDLLHGSIRIERTFHQLRDGSLIIGPPKTDAGRRTIHYPPTLADAVAEHLSSYVGADPESLLFTGEKGGPLRPHVLQAAWQKARDSVGVNYHLHDLRHLGATLAAGTGASTKEDHAPAWPSESASGPHLPTRQ